MSADETPRITDDEINEIGEWLLVAAHDHHEAKRTRRSNDCDETCRNLHLARDVIGELAAEVRALTAQRDAAQAALRQIRSIGARSGTNLNAWNEAFDVLDRALAGASPVAADPPAEDVVLPHMPISSTHLGTLPARSLHREG